jgi:hypothetical protein
MWKFGGGGKMANQSAQQEHAHLIYISLYGLAVEEEPLALAD